MAALLFIGLVAVALGYPVRPDEVEHVHAAWLVAVGQVPYRDFFQHHHPLLWLTMAPLVPVLPQSSAAVILLRFGHVGVALVTVWLAWRLAWLSTYSSRVAWIAVILLGSSGTFVISVMQIRPDPGMTMFVLWSAVLLMSGVAHRRPGEQVLAGIAAGVAVLFLQKAVLLFLALFVLGLAAHWTRVWRWDHATVVRFVAGALIPCGVGAAWLIGVGAARDYVVTNGVFNVSATLETVREPNRVAGLSLIFWALGLWGAVAVLGHRQQPRLWAVGVLALSLVGGLVLARAFRAHYLLQAAPFLAVVAAWKIEGLLDRFRAGPVLCGACVALLVLPVPVHVVDKRSAGDDDASRRVLIDYVLARTGPAEAVYDPSCQFNLFRRDLDYVGGSAMVLASRMEKYARATGTSLSAYDPCELIRDSRPRFVHDPDTVFDRCGLSRSYVATPFTRLYERTP